VVLAVASGAGVAVAALVGVPHCANESTLGVSEFLHANVRFIDTGAEPHHYFHAGFHQLLGGLKLFVEAIHARFGAVHACLGAICPFFGASHPELIKLVPPFAALQAFDRTLIVLGKLRLELSVPFLYFRIHSLVFYRELLHSKRQQHVARHAALPQIAGVHIHHSVHYHRSGAVDRSAVPLDAIDRIELAGCVEIPQQSAVF
jgi:hypothetical protein